MKEIKMIPKREMGERPIVSPDALIILDNFSNFISKPEDQMDDGEFLDKEALNDLYKAIGGEEQKLLAIFSGLEKQGVISKNHNLFSSCLLLMAKDIELGLNGISEMLQRGEMSLDLMRQELKEAPLSNDVKYCAEEIFQVISDYFLYLRLAGKKYI